MHHLGQCMFLNTVNEPCVCLLQDLGEKTVFAMVRSDQEPATWLSQTQLEQYFGVLFPCLRQGVARRAPRYQDYMGPISAPEVDAVAQLDRNCIICRVEFAADSPRICLPCETQAGFITRHSSVCRSCLIDLLAEAVSLVMCPVCETIFEIAQLVLQADCVPIRSMQQRRLRARERRLASSSATQLP